MSINKFFKSVTAKNPKIKVELDNCFESNKVTVRDDRECKTVD